MTEVGDRRALVSMNDTPTPPPKIEGLRFRELLACATSNGGRGRDAAGGVLDANSPDWVPMSDKATSRNGQTHRNTMCVTVA